MIEVAPLRQRDVPAAAALFNQATSNLPYRWDVGTGAFRDCVLFGEAAPEITLKGDSDGVLAAQAEGRMVGLAHCDIGQFPDDPWEVYRGFIRFFSTAPSAPMGTEQRLLAMVEAFFQQRKAVHVHAFHMFTGYDCVLAGRGMFPDNRLDLMGVLGNAKYKISDRWLLYEKKIDGYTPERNASLPGLTLWRDANHEAGFAFHVAEGAEPVASLVLDLLPDVSDHLGVSTASLERLEVVSAYQSKGVGRWLLQRALNELATMKIRRLLLHINHAEAAAQSLLQSLGFEELSVRGYTYEKKLDSSRWMI